MSTLTAVLPAQRRSDSPVTGEARQRWTPLQRPPAAPGAPTLARRWAGVNAEVKMAAIVTGLALLSAGLFRLGALLAR